MQPDSARARAMQETRKRILDVALESLGRDPEASMGHIASAAGVVRRTVYGHFPTRADLLRALAQQAVGEIAAVLAEVDHAGEPAEEVWVHFIARLWPVVRRYRVLLVLRRGEYGEEIHALLRPVDEALAALVQRGQEGDAFARHLPAGVLSQIAFAAVFSVADSSLSADGLDAGAAAIASLLVLGVPQQRANALAAYAAHGPTG